MRGEKTKKNCGSCNKVFEDYVSNKRSGFCSLGCYWESKNGSKGFWLGKKRPEITGINSGTWKGDNIGYSHLHVWVRNNRLKSGKCEHCGLIKITDWANKSHKYKRRLDDWIELCRKCHIAYDRG